MEIFGAVLVAIFALAMVGGMVLALGAIFLDLVAAFMRSRLGRWIERHG